MATLYISNFNDLYNVGMGTWYRDDIPVKLKEVIESGKSLKIREWRHHLDSLGVNVPEWLRNDTFHIDSDDLDVLGFQEPENPESVIVTNGGDFPLHPTTTSHQFFGDASCDLRIDQLSEACNADILFIPLDFDAAQQLITTNIENYENRVVIYVDENNEIPIIQGVGRAIVFIDPSSLISVANSKQRVINIVRQFGYQAHNNHKVVVVTDGSYDPGFFDGSISLFFRSVI